MQLGSDNWYDNSRAGGPPQNGTLRPNTGWHADIYGWFLCRLPLPSDRRPKQVSRAAYEPYCLESTTSSFPNHLAASPDYNYPCDQRACTIDGFVCFKVGMRVRKQCCKLSRLKYESANACASSLTVWRAQLHLAVLP